MGRASSTLRASKEEEPVAVEKAEPAKAEVEDLPVFDLAAIVAAEPGSLEEESLLPVCQKMADCLHKTSCLVVRDPRVSEGDNAEILSLMQRYYAQSYEAKMQDARPEIGYQVGVTPANVETAKCATSPECIAEIDNMPKKHRPVKPEGPDPKWRFFWRVGSRPEESAFPDLNAPAVVPEAFEKEWATTMDAWGGKTLGALMAVAEMLALGFDLPRSTFADLMHNGPHLLAPTGSDLSTHNEVDTIFAGYHNDLNFLTIHGKSNYPGLHIWLRDGSKRTVTVPDGCLLLQAGQQMEYVTGGYVKAGMHEVVVSPKTVAVLEARQKAAAEEGREMAPHEFWRISTTMFGTLCHDAILKPLGGFAEQPTAQDYPPILGGDQVANALKSIGMADEMRAAGA